MAIEFDDDVPPIASDIPEGELQDYFCPFCTHKLFRGNVTQFNMACSHCNKLVRSDLVSTRKPDIEEPEEYLP